MTDQTKPIPTQADLGGELTKITECYTQFVLEVTYQANDREMPGGDAMQAVTPSASLQEWEEQFEAAEAEAVKKIDAGRAAAAARMLAYVFDQEDTDTHPELVLTDWEAQIRTARGEQVNLRSNVHKAAAYIRRSIPWLYSLSDAGQPVFVEHRALHKDLRNVRQYLESILKSGNRAEFTRVHCISDICETHPRLMKLWAAQVRWDCYRCPACRTEYDYAQFKMAEAQNLHSQGAARFVIPSEAMKASGVPKDTMYSWMRRGNVLCAREMPGGRTLVWWPDVRDRAVERDARLKLEQAKKEAAAQEQARLEAACDHEHVDEKTSRCDACGGVPPTEEPATADQVIDFAREHTDFRLDPLQENLIRELYADTGNLPNFAHAINTPRHR